ncbi:MAG: plasmid pRiA4b ORF-3 family protein [Planctomycetota bacterium]|nr:plasmid pRiA4b ORF-3 family protein [Planctomycetota bacterium]
MPAPAKKPGAARSRAKGQVLVLEVALLDLKPRIWRRFAIADGGTLAELHYALQAVMGWYDCHLHEFAIRGQRYGVPDPEMNFDEDEDLLDEAKFKLARVLGGPKTSFRYLYDFGDNWEHEVKVVAVQAPEPGHEYPLCLAGERACPPEDCGSTWGYGQLLDILKNPKHAEYKERVEWLDGPYDPERFDLAEVNERLRQGPVEEE